MAGDDKNMPPPAPEATRLVLGGPRGAAAGKAGAPLDAPRTVRIGDILNHIFEVKRFIARGGMGEVFEGINVNTEERVAIKVMLPSMAADEQFIALFRREARTLTKLSHPALVQYRLLAQEPQLGVFYIVTEFVDGTNLSDVIGDLNATPRDLLSLTRRLASGLEAAHALGAIHRDMSPDNVMLQGGQLTNARIVDFGVAKDMNADSQTIIGSGFAGKLNYVAPEQLGAFDRNIGPWTDIYSLGLVVLAVASGKHVDMGTTLVKAVDKRREGPDLSLAPAMLRPLLTPMLQADPADRLRSMSDVLRLVTKIDASLAALASDPEPPGTPLPPVAAPAPPEPIAWPEVVEPVAEQPPSAPVDPVEPPSAWSDAVEPPVAEQPPATSPDPVEPPPAWPEAAEPVVAEQSVADSPGPVEASPAWSDATEPEAVEPIAAEPPPPEPVEAPPAWSDAAEPEAVEPVAVEPPPLGPVEASPAWSDAAEPRIAEPPPPPEPVEAPPAWSDAVEPEQPPSVPPGAIEPVEAAPPSWSAPVDLVAPPPEPPETVDWAPAVPPPQEPDAAQAQVPPARPAASSKSPLPIILAAVGVLVLLVAATAWYFLYWQNRGDTVLQQDAAKTVVAVDQTEAVKAALASALPTVSCAWLNVASVTHGPDGSMVALRGVAGMPEDARAQITKMLASRDLKLASIDFQQVAPTEATECAPLDALRQIRDPMGGKMAMEQRQIELTKQTSGNFAGSLGAMAVVDFDLGDPSQEMSLFGMQPSGKISQLTSDRSELVAASDAVGGERYRLSIDVNHTGWSGLVLLTGQKPFDADLLAGPPRSHDEDWSKRFLTAARERGWKAEMIWFKTADDQPEAEAPKQ